VETFYLVGGMTLVTFLIRYLLLPLSGRFQFSSGMQRALGYVPPAVITAIVVPFALIPDGRHVQISLSNPYLIGACLTFGIGWLSKNLLLTIVGGMVCFWAWRAVLTFGWLSSVP
jgi:branched-subunit amino acid transport protein